MKTLLVSIIALSIALSGHAETLVDLNADYSDVSQGINGIQYGVYLTPNGVVGTFSTTGWVPVNGSVYGGPTHNLTDYWYGGDAFNTPSQDAISMHPAVSSLDPAVRRYTVDAGSDPIYTGEINIVGTFSDLNPSGSKSEFVTVDGTNLFDMSVPTGGAVPFNITVSVTPGSTIDFGVDPGGNAFSDLTGISATIVTVSDVPSGAVSIDTASPSQAAYINSNYTFANTGATTTFKSLTVEPGIPVTLGPDDTLVLTDGPLTIDEGATFSGNGIIAGNVINKGLLRIPIVRLDTVSNIQGGYTQITLPAPGPGPEFSSTNSIVVNQGTLVGFSGGSSGGDGVAGGASGAGNPTVINAPAVGNTGVIRLAPTVGYDASLEVTGSFTQTQTGKLRLFIGGNEKGVTYSHLSVDNRITLAGEIQIVLQPDLLGFLPTNGETFDLIESPDGISIPNGLTLSNFVTQAGASFLSGFPLDSYDSGIEDDPDQLYQIEQQLFTYSLIDNGTVLEATYVSPVPEPKNWIPLAVGAASLLVFAAGETESLTSYKGVVEIIHRFRNAI